MLIFVVILNGVYLELAMIGVAATGRLVVSSGSVKSAGKSMFTKMTNAQ